MRFYNAIFGIHQRHLTKADDCAQNVVEIMGNTTCQDTDGLQFLSMKQLGFQLGFFDFRLFSSCDICVHRLNRDELIVDKYG